VFASGAQSAPLFYCVEHAGEYSRRIAGAPALDDVIQTIVRDRLEASSRAHIIRST
jgi:hypothetical protein